MYATTAIWLHMTTPAMSAMGMASRSSEQARNASAVKACDACTSVVVILLAKVLCGRRNATVSAPTTWGGTQGT
jgi:hypothetical protein